MKKEEYLCLPLNSIVFCIHHKIILLPICEYYVKSKLKIKMEIHFSWRIGKEKD